MNAYITSKENMQLNDVLIKMVCSANKPAETTYGSS